MSLDELSPEQIEHIRVQVREKINIHFYAIEEINDPEKLQRLNKGKNYDKQAFHDK